MPARGPPFFAFFLSLAPLLLSPGRQLSACKIFQSRPWRLEWAADRSLAVGAGGRAGPGDPAVAAPETKTTPTTDDDEMHAHMGLAIGSHHPPESRSGAQAGHSVILAFGPFYFLCLLTCLPCLPAGWLALTRFCFLCLPRYRPLFPCPMPGPCPALLCHAMLCHAMPCTALPPLALPGARLTRQAAFLPDLA